MLPRVQRSMSTCALTAPAEGPSAAACALIASGRGPILLTLLGGAWHRTFGLCALLPGVLLVHQHHFHRGHLVLRAVGRPVGVLGGHYVGVGFREMEGRVHHAGRDLL